jgi:hypothetical protein
MKILMRRENGVYTGTSTRSRRQTLRGLKWPGRMCEALDFRRLIDV